MSQNSGETPSSPASGKLSPGILRHFVGKYYFCAFFAGRGKTELSSENPNLAIERFHPKGEIACH
jgi:hypothetical protein